MELEWGTQVAVKAILDPVVSPAEVLDYVPDNKPKPYVVLYDTASTASETDETTGLELIMEIRTYTGSEENRGRKEVKQIMDKIRLALHHQNITVPDAVVALMMQDSSEVRVEPDGLTHVGIQRIRFLMEDD